MGRPVSVDVRGLRRRAFGVSLCLAAIIASACSPSGRSAAPRGSPAGNTTLSTPATPGVAPSGPVGQRAVVSLSAPSSKVVWVLVNGSLLLRSTDRGVTWQPRPVPPGNFPGPEISFVDDHQGWLATGGVPATQCSQAGTAVWRTVDAGKTWQQVVSVDYEHLGGGGIGISQCKEGLSFIGAGHGFLGAVDRNSRPTIYQTADGGFNWTGRVLPDPPGYVTYGAGDTLTSGLVKAFGTTLLLPALGMQPNAQMEMEYVFRSLDGGTTWTSLAATGTAANRVTLVTASRWLKISNNQSALESADAGKTWHAFACDYQAAADQASVFVFADSLVGYGIAGGVIRQTVDGGHQWTLITTPGAS